MGGDRRRDARLVTRVAQFDVDAGVVMPLCRWAALPPATWLHPHGVLDTLDFHRLQLNTALAFRSPLKILDGVWLAADQERAGIRLGKPPIHGRPRNPQCPSGLGGG